MYVLFGVQRERTMRLDQIKVALSFISEPNSMVVIQVPFYRDLVLVKDEIVRIMGKPEVALPMEWKYRGNRIIKFECISSDFAGYGYLCPVVLVERLDGILPKSIERWRR